MPNKVERGQIGRQEKISFKDNISKSPIQTGIESTESGSWEGGKKNAFMLISIKLWINLPDKAAGTRNSHCFKTRVQSLYAGIPKNCCREKNNSMLQVLELLVQWYSQKLYLYDTCTVLNLCIRISFGYLPIARKFFLPMTHHLFSEVFFSFL